METGKQPISPTWADHVGPEARKTFQRLSTTGFFSRFLSGNRILDIGYRGSLPDSTPILPHAIGVDLDYPGYDGKTLPFSDESQDAIFTSHTLEHISDYRAAIADWFRVLRHGGFLIIAVPHKYLYERKSAPPSRFNGDHKRFYTAASLLAEIEEALDPMSYRIRHLEDNDVGFDYSIRPEIHAVGCYEILVVLEKIRRPDYADAVLTDITPRPEPAEQPADRFPDKNAEGPIVAIRTRPGNATAIAVVKVDHRGDFILARPAMLELRRLFPDARLTLFCGPWNRDEATNLHIFDEIIEVRFYDEQGRRNSDSDTVKAGIRTALQARRFDLAIDLRVDIDTRDLLSAIDADHRAGFGDVHEFSFLDIALPFSNPSVARSRWSVGAERFATKLGSRERSAIRYVGRPFVEAFSECLIYGPYLDLGPGSYLVELELHAFGRSFAADLDVRADAAREVLRARSRVRVERYTPITFEMSLHEAKKKIEFRVFSRPFHRVRPFWLTGCQIERRGWWQGPHQEELLYMLVAVAGLRLRNPYQIDLLTK